MRRISGGELYTVPFETLPQTIHKFTLTGDTEVDTIPAPGAGKALEVYGFYAQLYATTRNIDNPAKLKFETSAQEIWFGIEDPPGAETNYCSGAGGLVIRGDENEALTVTNTAPNGGLQPHTLHLAVYYRTISV